MLKARGATSGPFMGTASMECPRDDGGFCRIAMLGHQRCTNRSGGCGVKDKAAA